MLKMKLMLLLRIYTSLLNTTRRLAGKRKKEEQGGGTSQEPQMQYNLSAVY
jgi:hypothetical protein